MMSAPFPAELSPSLILCRLIVMIGSVHADGYGGACASRLVLMFPHGNGALAIIDLVVMSCSPSLSACMHAHISSACEIFLSLGVHAWSCNLFHQPAGLHAITVSQACYVTCMHACLSAYMLDCMCSMHHWGASAGMPRTYAACICWILIGSCDHILH
jgi:hypothetical protein